MMFSREKASTRDVVKKIDFLCKSMNINKMFIKCVFELKFNIFVLFCFVVMKVLVMMVSKMVLSSSLFGFFKSFSAADVTFGIKCKFILRVMGKNV